MVQRDILMDWVVDALKAYGGRARIVDVCKHIWQHHETDLRLSGDLFYMWQYEVRWAGQRLRNSGRLKRVFRDRSQPWELENSPASS